MILNGKEIRVLLGAITVFQHIPLSLTKKRKLTEAEDSILSCVFDTIITSIEKEYHKFENEKNNYVIEIEKRLSINLDYSFSKIEIRLIQEAIEVCIAESETRQDNSINDYFNGDQYGIDIDDFRGLFKRWEHMGHS